MNSNNQSRFWEFDSAYWISSLSSTPNGLTSDQAKVILLRQGNIKKIKSRFHKDLFLFLSQFRSPLMILLIGAVVLSAFLGDHSDVYIILSILLSTGFLSFFQERSASKVIEKLQSMIAIKCMVQRDAQFAEVEAKFVVPGDIILLHAGDMIPADCMLIESNELHVNESSLTGESFPVRKFHVIPTDTKELAHRTHCLWEGTSVVSGKAAAIIINTGDNTVFGGIVKGVSKVIETSFEQGIKKFGYFLITITLILAVFIMVVNLYLHKSFFESALFALALAVGMAPELLPAITTIAMSSGAKKMLEKKVIVKKLTSIQNLGEINLLCTDKTGTITEGIITVKGFIDGAGNESENVKKLSVWNAGFQSGYGNPIDEILKQITLNENPILSKLDEIPYDFTRKRISILLNTEEGKLLITKGAYNEISSICTKINYEKNEIKDIQLYRKKLNHDFEQYGLGGLRTLAICYKYVESDHVTLDDENNMTFSGFILLEDPIKENITETINALSRLSVELKIITGDNKNIARSMAHQIGIDNPLLLTGKDLFEMDEASILKLIASVHIFAEVEPQQKEHIIQLLRKSFTVAYIGDGINDVSAINAADVGISVDNAVDIAKEAADFVLMEKNLMVIIDGIMEGRKAFANTLKYIFVNTGSTFGNMFSVAVASLLLPFLPMLPKQILLTNFITDFPYLSISSDNVDASQLIKPGKWNFKLVRNYMILFGIHSTFFDVLTFITLFYILKVKESTFQTGWFIESVLTELFILFIIRTKLNFFKSKPGKYLIILSIIGSVITLTLPYIKIGSDVGLIPLPVSITCAMLLIVLLYIITADLLKVWFFKQPVKF